MTPQKIDRLISLVIRNLPDSIREREQTLSALLDLIPEDYDRRADIAAMLTTIQQHESAQNEFRFS